MGPRVSTMTPRDALPEGESKRVAVEGMCTAVSTSHAPLASTRTAVDDSTASRTAATRPTLAAFLTLTFTAGYVRISSTVK